eukprot:COSAG01_NODE_56844_length_316_cov_0.520737_1_plen_61_part_01
MSWYSYITTGGNHHHYQCSEYAAGGSLHQFCNIAVNSGLEAAIHCPTACGCVQDCEGVWGG